MKRPNPQFSQCTLLTLSLLSLSITVFSSLFTQVPAQSQTVPRDQTAYTNITPIVKFQPPSGRRVGDSRGGATRPTAVKCSQDAAYRPSMTPLLPDSKQGLTNMRHPTFWVYVPPTSAPQIHFTLKDENNRGIYQSLIPITKTGEIISINLPEDGPPLDVGKTYQWSVALLCQPTQTDIPIVGGKIELVEPDSVLRTQLEQKTALEQAASYGQAGIWYDMVNNLAQLRKTQPNNSTITTNWIQLLNSVGLEDIATKPVQ